MNTPEGRTCSGDSWLSGDQAALLRGGQERQGSADAGTRCHEEAAPTATGCHGLKQRHGRRPYREPPEPWICQDEGTLHVLGLHPGLTVSLWSWAPCHAGALLAQEGASSDLTLLPWTFSLPVHSLWDNKSSGQLEQSERGWWAQGDPHREAQSPQGHAGGPDLPAGPGPSSRLCVPDAALVSVHLGSQQREMTRTQRGDVSQYIKSGGVCALWVSGPRGRGWLL